ncbi:MAG TPA: hypothetical protein VGF20_04510 [Candidatus Acidoferrum sp.]|jgi:Tfp pilus assembly protein PilX
MLKNKKKNHKRASREKGVALLIAIITLLLVTAITAGIVLMANTESNTSTNFKDEQRAFFSARAGIEEVRDRFRANTTVTADSLYTLLPTTAPGSGSTGVIYVLNPLNGETVAPWTSTNKYADDEICKETTAVTCSSGYPSGSYYTSKTASTTYQASSGAVMDWKWVRIQPKLNNAFGTGYAVNGVSTTSSFVCWKDGSPYELASSVAATTTTLACPSPNLPVYVLTTLAVTPSGSRRMLQTEIAQDQLNFTAPSALTMDGTSDLFSGGTANNWGVSGVDTTVAGCGSNTGAGNKPAIGVPDGTPTAGSTPATGDIKNVINGVYGNSGNGVGNQQSSGIPSGNLNNYPGLAASPDVENVSSVLPGNKLDTTTDLTSLVSALKVSATQPVVAAGTQISGNGGLFNSIDTHGNPQPQIVYANGDLTLTGSSTGYGILVVTGTLTMKGTVTWNGIILVVGSGVVQTDGTNQFNGAVVVAKTTGGSLGSPIFNVNGGGNGSVNYSSGCVAQATLQPTFHMISIRELMN